MTDPADDDKRPLLNLGCGFVQPDEPWLNADSDASCGRGVFLVDPVAPGGLPWPDDYFAATAAHHVLQMVAWPELVPWLVEVRRVTDGPVRISVPDLLGAVAAYHEGDIDWFPIADEHERFIGGKLTMYLTQAGATRSMFTTQHLFDLCVRAGFDHIMRPAYGISEQHPKVAALDSRPRESLFVEAW